MRAENSPMTEEEFEEAVELALDGSVVSCNGASTGVRQALEAIIDADPLEQDESVREAHRAYQNYLVELQSGTALI